MDDLLALALESARHAGWCDGRPDVGTESAAAATATAASAERALRDSLARIRAVVEAAIVEDDRVLFEGEDYALGAPLDALTDADRRVLRMDR